MKKILGMICNVCMNNKLWLLIIVVVLVFDSVMLNTGKVIQFSAENTAFLPLIAIAKELNQPCFWQILGILKFMIVFALIFFLIIRYRIKIDRLFAESHWTNSLKIIGFIVAIPFIMWVYVKIANIPLHELWWNGENSNPGQMWTVFYYFLDPGNQHMASSAPGQAVAMILALLGTVLMSGLLVSFLTNLIDRRAEEYIEGRCRYKHNSAFGKFAVIIGGHEMAVSLCKYLFEKKMADLDYIFIHTSGDIQLLRSKLRSTLGKKEAKIVIYYGERNIEKEMDALYCNHAEGIYILGEENEPLHDAKNMKCVTYLTEKVAKTLPCYVLFEYQTTFAAFQASSKKASNPDKGEHLIFIPFNFHETWAQKVLTGEYEPENKDKYIPLDGAGIKYEDNDTVHVIIIGMSRMGVAMGVETAHVAHYPNFIRNNSLRTRITFIDSNMQQEREFFMSRYKSLFDVSRWRSLDKENMNSEWANKHTSFIDVEWEFIDGGIQSPHIYKYIEEAIRVPHRKITIAVCLPITSQAMASTLYLPDSVYTEEQVQQVLIYQKHEDALAQHLSTSPKYKKLKPFGMTNESYTDALIVESLRPRLTGRVYSILSNWKEDLDNQLHDQLLKELKDKEQMNNAWNTSEIWGQWSNIYNACAIPTKERGISISEEEYEQLWNAASYKEGRLTIDPEQVCKLDLHHRLSLLAEVEHNRWNVEKLLMGYRILNQKEKEGITKLGIGTESYKTKRGLLKGDPTKAHLDICPFSELKVIDPGVEDYDYLLSLAIPDIKALAKELDTTNLQPEHQA